jgi:hypothetical protein
MQREERDEHGAADDAGNRAAAAEAARVPGSRHPVDEDRDPGREQREAERVETEAELRLCVRQQPLREQQRKQSDGEVDEEDPAPARLVDDRPADYRVVFIPDCLSSDSTLGQVSPVYPGVKMERTRDTRTLWLILGAVIVAILVAATGCAGGPLP